MKTCTKCGIEKPLTEFYKRPDRPCGYVSKCKECNAKHCKQYQRKNLHKFREYGAAFRARHPERVKAIARASRQRNSAHRNKYNAEYAKRNKDAWNIKTQRRYARLLGSKGSYSAAEWKALKEKYRYTCLACRRTESEIKLTADHVVPLTSGGCNSISNIQPLCGPCNSSKHTKTIDYRLNYDGSCNS